MRLPHGMRQVTTEYGDVCIGPVEALFSKAAELVLAEASKRTLATVGLPGGSTPQRWFQWLIKACAFDEQALNRLSWLTSDERYVPLDSPESNFGNAARLLLDPLGVPETRRMPWPVQVDPHSAAIVFNRRWSERFGQRRCFDLCFLGMGDDGHTASIFPGSPLIGLDSPDSFAAVDVPGKGWRLTITECGLERCGRIVVMVLGAGKAARLRSVLQGDHDPSTQPIQLLRAVAPNVTWLVDDAAAANIG